MFSPAFVADCLETTIEIGFEYKEQFLHAGGEKLDLVESLNDDEDWVSAIAEMVKKKDIKREIGVNLPLIYQNKTSTRSCDHNGLSYRFL